MLTVITQLFQTMRAECFSMGQNRIKPPSAPPLANTLVRTRIGQPVRLLAVHAERKVVHRLAELGLTPGVTLTVVQVASGPLLVAVRGARVALGRELAEQMEVVPLP